MSREPKEVSGEGKSERIKHIYRLCNHSDNVEGLALKIKDLTHIEITWLMEYIFSLSGVKQDVCHMAIAHINHANRSKMLASVKNNHFQSEK